MVNPSVSKRESKPHPSGGGGRGINQFAFFFFFFFLPPFFPPPDGARGTERTNERTNERALITVGGGQGQSLTFFLSGVWSSGAVPPLPSPHPFLQPPMYVMRGGLRLRAEPAVHGCAQYICKNRQRKISIFLFFLLPKCVFPFSSRLVSGSKNGLVGKREPGRGEKKRGGKHGQSNKEEEEEGET